MKYMLLIHQGTTPTPNSCTGEAHAACSRTLALVHDDAERRLLERRLVELEA